MKAYTTKSGVTQYKASFKSIEQAGHDFIGFCLACGNEQEGCEPDMRKAVCESCGKPKVYGGEELVLMGLVH